MSNKRVLRVGVSPITNTIYAGHLLKCGQVWAANKQDVTIDALVAVAMHVENFGRPVVIHANGKPEYEITVRKLNDADND